MAGLDAEVLHEARLLHPVAQTNGWWCVTHDTAKEHVRRQIIQTTNERLFEESVQADNELLTAFLRKNFTVEDVPSEAGHKWKFTYRKPFGRPCLLHFTSPEAAAEWLTEEVKADIEWAGNAYHDRDQFRRLLATATNQRTLAVEVQKSGYGKWRTKSLSGQSIHKPDLYTYVITSPVTNVSNAPVYLPPGAAVIGVHASFRIWSEDFGLVKKDEFWQFDVRPENFNKLVFWFAERTFNRRSMAATTTPSSLTFMLLYMAPP